MPEHLEFGITKLDVMDRRCVRPELVSHREVLEALSKGDETFFEKMREKERKGITYAYPCPKPCGKLKINVKTLWDGLYPSISATIRGGEQRLSLYDALVSVHYNANIVKTRVCSFVDANRNVLVVRQLDDGKLQSYQTVELYKWTDSFLGTAPTSNHDGKRFWIEYAFPDGFRYVMLAAIEGATYRIEKQANRIIARLEPYKSGEFTIFLTVVTNRENEHPLEEAKRLIDEAMSVGYARLLEEHKAWWHAFWGKSFIDLSDDLVENLWYIQLYQLASMSRGYPAPKLYGLWCLHDVPGWRGIYTADINIEMAYWPIFTSNHPELGKPFYETFFRMLPNVKEETKKLYNIDGARYPCVMIEDGFELATDRYRYAQCISAFLAQIFWWHYIYTLDKGFLEERAYPVMRESARFYEGYLSRDDQGKYYIYPSFSPEQGPLDAKNPTIDLALIKALLRGTIEASRILEVDREERGKWQEILDNLSDYTIRDNVLQDSESASPDLKLAHPSLLAPIFPGGDIGVDSARWLVACNTLKTILSRTWRRSLTDEPNWDDSFSSQWLLCAAARLGLGEEAKNFLYNLVIHQHLKPNGLFSAWTCTIVKDDAEWERKMTLGELNEMTALLSSTVEGREKQEVFMDGGSGFLTGVNEMLLQSYDGRIRVFPALPRGWDARMAGLRAVGAFLVASEVKNGEVKYILVSSLKGQECTVINPWPDEEVNVRDIKTGQIIQRSMHKKSITFETTQDHTYAVERSRKPLETFPKITLKGRRRTKPRKCVRAKDHVIYLGKPYYSYG